MILLNEIHKSILIFIQACEQLNSWLAGFESILKRMNPENFDWFLHVMLFHHTQLVLAKIENQKEKGIGLGSQNNHNNLNGEGGGDEDEDDNDQDEDSEEEAEEMEID